MTLPIVAVLLAAGAGTRFGGDKLLAPLPAPSHGVPAGTPLARAALAHLRAAGLEVVAVVRPGDAALARTLEEGGARVVACAQAHEGMGYSLAAGITQAQAADGWLVALADMPWIAPATIARLAQRVADGAGIVVPRHAGRRGHPVGFAARHAGALRALGGDEGARRVIAAHADEVVMVDVEDAGVLRDVDTPADLSAPA